MLAGAHKYHLPTDGPVPFVPPKRWNPNSPARTSDGKGFIDNFGNEWRKGPSRTAGEAIEWDVIPNNKSGGLSNLSRDGSHVNVSLTGEVSHR
ncbi:MAG: polymorphic toxin type 17 domain-containing protein [Candidatus Sericytochromatia bacterium]